jgi:hypothetical protein
VEVTLPDGWIVDELPPPIALDSEAASYNATTEVRGNTLRFTRAMQIKERLVAADRTEQLKSFFRQVSASEKSRAVMKKQ